MSEKSEYTHGIWIRKLKINLIAKDFGEEINKLKIRLAKMATRCEMDYHDLALEAVIRGLEVMEREYHETEEFTQGDDLDDEHKRLIALFDTKYEIARRRQLLDDLLPIYEDFGQEAFEEWCEEHHFDIQEFYILRNESLQKLSWSKRVRAWITDQVKNLSSPMRVEDFMQMARNDSLIDDSNERAFYQHISRLGYLNKPHGHVFDE